MTYTPYLWLLLIPALLNGSLALYTRQYHAVPSVKPFQMLMWLVTAWALLYGLGISITHLPLRIFIVNVTYIPSILTGIASLALALEYTGRTVGLTRRRLMLLLGLPLLFLILAFSSQWHHLWRYDYQLQWSGSVPVVVATKGIFYWIYAAYMLGLFLAAFAILVTSFRYRTLYFRNTVVLTLGMLVPVVVAILYVFGLTPVHGFDWMPTSFIWMGALYIWAVLRGRLFDAAPIARNMLVDTLEDLMIAVNTRGLIIDFNRAAQTALSLSPSSIGMPPATLPQPWAKVFQDHAETSGCREEVVIAGHTYDLTISPILDTHACQQGRIFLFNDITSRKQVEAEERKQRILAQALQETSQALNSTLNYQDVLEKILVNVGRVVPVDSANIALLGDEGVMQYLHFYGYMEHRVAKEELQGFTLDTSPIFKRVFDTGEPVIIPDTHADPAWIVIPSGAWIRSYAAMPIRVREKVVGVLNLDSAVIGFYTLEHVHNLRAFADQVAIAVENARLFATAEHEIMERKQAEEKLRQLSQAVEQSPASIIITDTTGRIEYINPRFSEVTGYSWEDAIGKKPSILKTDKTPPEMHRQLWQAITTGGEWRGQFINKKKNGEEYFESTSISPILDDAGMVTHYLAVKEDTTPQKLAEDELRNKNQILQFQLEAIEELQAELREQAVRDPLTGLYNRRYLAETQERELARAARERYPVSFVMIDIDHFKILNDTYGHDAGDFFLEKLAALLQSQTRIGDIVYRYGGEEILVIMSKVTAEVAFLITNRWRAAFMDLKLSLEMGDAQSTISCGISEYPRHAVSSSDLITLADKAMYKAKAAGRNRVVIWNAAAHDH